MFQKFDSRLLLLNNHGRIRTKAVNREECMATIKDIARLAGVSHGTVSNVLNGRGNVSMKKIILVEQAARQLGYSIDERSKQLRQEFERSIAVVLPNLRDERYAILYAVISQQLTDVGYKSSLYLTGDIPAQEEAALSEIAGRRFQGVILCTCQPCSSEARETLQKNGVAIVAVERRAEGTDAFLGFDPEAISREVACQLSGYGCRQAAMITGLLIHSSESSLQQKVTASLEPFGISLKPYQTDAVNASVAAFSICTDAVQADAVFTTSPRFCESLMDAYNFCGVQPPLLITLSATGCMPSGGPVHRITLNWKKLACMACCAVLAPQESHDILLTPEKTPEYNVHTLSNRTRINALMLEGPEAKALMRLLPDFTKRTGIEVRMLTTSYPELHETIRTMGTSGFYDVIRMDVVWLESMAKGRLHPFDPNDPEIQSIFAPILPAVRENFSVSNGVSCAFPFTPNVQLHFYRRDLFEDSKVRRAYYEQYRDTLSVPGDYGLFRRLLDFFNHEINPAAPVEAGATTVSSTVSGIVCEFLPVLLSNGGQLFDEAGRPALNTTQALESLRLYLDIERHTLSVPSDAWWKGAVDHFVSGRTAMMNMFINHASGITDLRKSKIAGRIGFASVPGGRPLLGGGVLGISEHSTKKAAALEFIRWTCSEHLSRPFTLLGGISPCASVYSCEDLLELYPWLSIVPENYAIAAPRKVPGSLDEYAVENVLGRAIKNAIYGVCTPAEALAFAQEQLEGQMNRE